MELINALRNELGTAYVLVDQDTLPWSKDWMGVYHWSPLAVVRPSDTHEVSKVVQLCNAHNVAMVPVGGNTGLTGATQAQDAVMISLDRLNEIHRIDPDAMTAVVGAGAILHNIHEAADAHDLIFPLYFGARGSAMIGGNLSTNAGGSNVLRYGNTRDLCLGLEVVLPDGAIMDVMSELHKDNSGLNLKHLFIGGEGTLGIITAAVLKLYPKPLAYATAMVGLRDLRSALPLLNRLQRETGSGVEAFEFMPRRYIERHLQKTDGAIEPFEGAHEINILVEIATTRSTDLEPETDGTPRLTAILERSLADMIENDAAQDAVIAQNENQRRTMWERREAAAEITLGEKSSVDTDVAVSLSNVPVFLERISPIVAEIDPTGQEFYIAHLGDGNLHYTYFASSDDLGLRDQVMEAIENVVLELGGSFSAEHGIGTSKLNSMARRKNPAALALMRKIKASFDPKNLMNPGKVYPTENG